VFANRGVDVAQRRFVTLYAKSPRDVPPRAFSVHSNAGDWDATATPDGSTVQVSVCVPPRGFADVRVHAARYGPIYGDPRSESSFFSYARSGGVLLTGIALADELGSC
jgi:hypothetical protein